MPMTIREWKELSAKIDWEARRLELIDYALDTRNEEMYNRLIRITGKRYVQHVYRRVGNLLIESEELSNEH